MFANGSDGPSDVSLMNDCDDVVDDRCVRADGRSHDGEVTGIDEVVEAAVDELV